MKNTISFENGIIHDFTEDEIRLLKLLISNHSREVADKYNIDLGAVASLKVLFVEHLD